MYTLKYTHIHKKEERVKFNELSILLKKLGKSNRTKSGEYKKGIRKREIEIKEMENKKQYKRKH